ncbi:helix-turn-helix domain-containing protein [Oceanobacillus jeddahense]|uniref:Helix-turn-helix transcriptional regulator n=1 Tax=Oceanobacillus jeddahense TaxID=1462527 RepID=A0ABY5JVB1_9BACI|nr:tetratricopeptide repeat protein [Oceanobacillus jeddahense]UUI03709.1 helix-turn-helix transcriptional regulator [Oceanobacillus jeddahense]
MDLGQKLKFLRNKQNSTQHEIVEGICSVSYYSKIENGNVVPNEEILQLLAKKFGITMQELIQTDEVVNDKVMQEAENIYNLIKENQTAAKEAYQSFLNRFRDSSNPSVRLLISLIELRFALRFSTIEEAKEKFQEAESLQDFSNMKIMPLFNRVCGLYHYAAGNYDKALELYLALVNALNFPYKADIHYEISLTYNRKNDVYKSIQHLEKALNAYLREMNYDQCTVCYFLLGINYFKMGNYDEAIDYYHRVEKVIENDKDLLRKVYHNLGLAFEKKKDIEKAIHYYQESLSIYTEEEHNTKTIYTLAELYLSMENKKTAASYIAKGKIEAEKFDLKEYIIKFHVLQLRLNGEEFHEYLEKVAIPFFKEINETSILIQYNVMLSNYYSQNKLYKQAYFKIKNVLEMKGGI